MKALLLAVLLLLPACPLCCAELKVSPEEIVNGGVALLRWQGDPSRLVVARYRDRIIFLRPTAEGRVALIGADVDLAPGSYPIRAAVIDRRGETTFYQTQLTVHDAEHPVERLTLPPKMVTPREPEVVERILREKKNLDDLFGRGAEPRLWQGFRRPVGDPVSSPFGLRRILNGEPRSPHSGVDFRSPLGRPVQAAARGEVALADELYFTGRTVVIDHGGGLFTYYAHLNDFACQLGQTVEAGEVVGTVGSTGRATGPHLHWGGKLRGDRIDPLALVELLGEEKP